MNGIVMKTSKLLRTYDRFEIVKVPFPFADSPIKKIRPALVLSSAKHFNAKIGCSILAMITSLKPDKALWPTDLVIENFSEAGLPIASIIRFKIFTLDHKLILDRLGTLSAKDQLQAQMKIKEILVI